MYFGEPFFTNVFERGRRCNREADKENISLGVGERSKAVVIFLSRGVKEAKSVRFVTDPVEKSVFSRYVGKGGNDI